MGVKPLDGKNLAKGKNLLPFVRDFYLKRFLPMVATKLVWLFKKHMWYKTSYSELS
jgi:hypothetical protein